MNKYQASGKVKRFPGKGGWYYLPINQDLSADFREIVKDKWPALLGVNLTLGSTKWRSSIMPIKDGPLFIALPAKVRKAEDIDEGSNIEVTFELNGE